MVKDKVSAIVSNPKLSIASFKIILNEIKEFSILIINSKYAKNMHIL